MKNQNGEVVEKISPKPAGNVGVDQGVLDATIEGMRRVVDTGGTGEWSFKGKTLPFVGKSGTGEMWGKQPINWFAGWVENEDQPLVVVAMVEEGGLHSDITAAPVVRHTLEAYYGVEQSPEDQWRTADVKAPGDEQAAPRGQAPHDTYQGAPAWGN